MWWCGGEGVTEFRIFWREWGNLGDAAVGARGEQRVIMFRKVSAGSFLVKLVYVLIGPIVFVLAEMS